MMAAPPLPPRVGGTKVLWPQIFPPEDMFDSTHIRASSPPPLPPRRWVGSSSTTDVNELLRALPPPSQATFKRQSDKDLISLDSLPFSGTSSIHQLFLDSSAASKQFSGNRQIRTDASQTWFKSTAFCNEVYLHNERQTELQQSWSAPDLASLQRTKPIANDIDSIFACMKKRDNNNLIDLNSHDDEHKVQKAHNKHQTSNDILSLFDPLADVVAKPVSPSPFLCKPSVSSVSEVDGYHTGRVAEKESSSSLNGKTDPNVSPHVGDEPLQVLQRSTSCWEEMELFAKKLKQLRSEFRHDDFHTNLGLVISPVLESYREDNLSIRLIIDTDRGTTSFTCDVSTAIEHVISHVVCDRHPDAVSMDGFVLKVRGLAEYFAADSTLVDYEYVHQCHTFDLPVHLTLVDAEKLARPLARTENDDIRDTNFATEELLTVGLDSDVTYRSVAILLETLHAIMKRLREELDRSQEIQQPLGISQSVKAICTHLGCIETTDITDAIQKVYEIILMIRKSQVVHNDDEEERELRCQMDERLAHLLSCIHQLLHLYCQTYHVDFALPEIASSSPNDDKMRDVTCLQDTLLCKVEELHRIPTSWASEYECFSVKCELRYGTRILATVESPESTSVTKSFFDRLVFDCLLEFSTTSMCTLPRESRLCFLVQGKPVSSQEGETLTTVLGWTYLGLFNHGGQLVRGTYLLGLFPKTLNPADCSVASNLVPGDPLLRVQLPQLDFPVRFLEISLSGEDNFPPARTFESLDARVQARLNRIVDGDSLAPLEEKDRELLWEKRLHLQARPQALPKLLQAAESWGGTFLPELYTLIRHWTPMPPADALVLLLPQFPDIEVRRIAISWLKGIGSDELCDYLPQLVQVIRFEPWLDSPVVWFLLERSLTSIRVAHHLYWLLRQVDDPLASKRCSLIANALLKISGNAFVQQIERQVSLVQSLGETARLLKSTKESLRLSNLFQNLERLHHTLREAPTSLPLSPAMEVDGVSVKSCAYFTSNTLPLKVVFESGGKAAIFKVGDDLRQDMLTLQMIRIMDKLWLKDGLDLKIVTFGCVATGPRMGLVEMVEGAETLRKIQTELGLTGSFKERPIAEWLAKHNPSELEYQQAVKNFTLSCAGYCVATHVLGIGDRHNDNIMLKTSGHLFHIDFGKFLGDSQMFGNIKRDRAPFVLTSDMAYVINGGDKPTKRFQVFVELCCLAFNILRRRTPVFLNLFALMLSSEIPGVTSETVRYVEHALLPNFTEGEATAHFARLIEESLRSWFTQFNFFIHNLAQLRFTGDHNDSQLLSFTPKTYTKESDGRIIRLTIIASQKRYDPEKRYLYLVQVDRKECRDPSFVARSYREFCELQQKLCIMFSLAKFHTLPRGALMGRSNVREVAERRRIEVSAFLKSLLSMAEEIAHCSLVYTFFHPLLRDQEGATVPDMSLVLPQMSPGPTDTSKAQGHIKLSIIFKNNSFFIMVMHAKNLKQRGGGKQPDPYVKTYLLPDPAKLTKRKTKIVYRNAHPTFMEMIVYQLPLEVVRRRTLHASVWDYDKVQENQFLGAAVLPMEDMDLQKETTNWYQLEYLPFRPGS